MDCEMWVLFFLPKRRLGEACDACLYATAAMITRSVVSAKCSSHCHPNTYGNQTEFVRASFTSMLDLL